MIIRVNGGITLLVGQTSARSGFVIRSVGETHVGVSYATTANALE
jgi:hypothetical protein